MTRGRIIGWASGALLLGVLLGFAAELLRRQPAAKVQQRYVSPHASDTPEAASPAPGSDRALVSASSRTPPSTPGERLDTGAGRAGAAGRPNRRAAADDQAF